MSSQEATIPAPYLVAPTYQWDGDDGSWSTFAIEAGTPPQTFRLLPSTIGEEVWLPIPEGCESWLSSVSDCGSLRGSAVGRGWNYDNSTSWVQTAGDPYFLTTERNLFGNVNTGIYGLDTISLGILPGDGYGTDVVRQTIAGISTEDFWLGALPLGTSPGKFSGDSSNPSLLVSMKAQNITSSLSYGYTAGQSYASIPGSLILGGYDQARISSNSAPVSVLINGSATSQTLELGVQSITASNVLGGSFQQLLSNPITVNVDSAVSQLWLPSDVCDGFVSAFGLEYSEQSNYYLLNSSTRSQLQANNPSITITIGSPSGGGASTNIVLPYSAFDHNLSLPLVNSTTPYPYFPLRKAANESQYTFGRVFLQESYIIVDWERNNFTVAQAAAQNSTSNVKIISPVSQASASSSSSASPTHHAKMGLPTGAIAAVAIVLIAIIAVVGGIALFIRRRKRRAYLQAEHGRVESTAPEVHMSEHYPPEKLKDEKSGSPLVQVTEFDSEKRPGLHERTLSELDNMQIHEMAERDRELMSTPVFELPGHTVGSEMDVRSSNEDYERTTSNATNEGTTRNIID